MTGKTLNDIASSLRARLEELTLHVRELETELRKPLPADFEEQASDLENQDGLVALERNQRQEIRQIEAALQHMENGTYGICVECGNAIAIKRLEAVPTATRCIDCAV